MRLILLKSEELSSDLVAIFLHFLWLLDIMMCIFIYVIYKIC